MTGKTSGDSSRRVSGNIFTGIQDSFTTQGLGDSGDMAVPESATRGFSRARERPQVPLHGVVFVILIPAQRSRSGAG